MALYLTKVTSEFIRHFVRIVKFRHAVECQRLGGGAGDEWTDMRKRGRVCGVRWCVRRTMRARIDGRVMVVGRRAAAAHQVTAAGAGGERARAHAAGQARPAPTLDPHAPLLPGGRLGMGCGAGCHPGPDARSWSAPSERYSRRRSYQALRARCPHASRYLYLLTLPEPQAMVADATTPLLPSATTLSTYLYTLLNLLLLHLLKICYYYL